MGHFPIAFQPFTLNLGGRLTQVARPQIAGIINVTPDSFYVGSRLTMPAQIAAKANEMAAQGADWIDLGAYSSRPGADDVPVAEEIARLRMAMKAINESGAGLPVSVDTFRADVARAAVEEMGCLMVNDISGGDLDPLMTPTVASLKVPYVAMHMRGTPATMQSLTDYGAEGVCGDVVLQLSRKIESLRMAGVADVLADPGFGFSKTLEQNYELLRSLPLVGRALQGVPLYIGLSRKSMFYKLLGITAEQALCPTVVANTIALMGGAAFLRVHDVAEAAQARAIVTETFNPDIQGNA